MTTLRLWLAGLTLLLGAALSAVWADPPANPKPSANDKAIEDLAAAIDRHTGQRIEERKIKPAPLTDDAEFMRRAYVDIAGRIPSAAEARTFLNDKDPYKRNRLVAQLLDSPAYVNNFAHVWRGLLLPELNSNFDLRFSTGAIENWIRRQLTENVPYDKMVRELITTKIVRDRRRDEFYDPRNQGAETLVFFQAKDGKPENLAAATSQTFLGIKLDCAQCHDHPFAKWTRTQFWQFAAFFAGIQRQGDNFYNPLREINDRRELGIPGKDEVVQAAFLDGTEPQWKYRESARTTLADWLTAPENPFFAKAAVNRMWHHFFGIGLVEPMDDFRADNLPSHPELLEELARQFAAQKFDVKFLIRAITMSRAYQLTSATTDPSQNEPRLFSKMPVKGMTGEQLFDSIALATGYRDPIPPQRRAQVGGFLNTPRNEFLNKFHAPDKKTEVHTSILQALTLMNGKFVDEATSIEKSDTLTALNDAPFMTTAGRIEALYLATLSRKPRADELADMVKYVDSGGPKKDPKIALGDVFWALLNSSEFMLNH